MRTANHPYDWEILLNLKSGHRYFAEVVKHTRKPTGRIGVADNSGTYPDSTDDGVLYLDKARAINVGSKWATVPLYRLNGDRIATGESLANAPLVAAKFGMKLVVDEDVATMLEGYVRAGTPLYLPNGDLVRVTALRRGRWTFAGQKVRET